MAGETVLSPTGMVLLDADQDEWDIRSINPAFVFLNAQFADVSGTPVVKVGAGGTGSITGSIAAPGALTFAAGGTNNDVTLIPAGTGSIVLSGPVVPSAPIRLPAGTVALPALTTVGSLGTGLAFPATNTLTVSTAGAERLRITSGGLVGIGMTPVNRLDVNGDATVTRLGVSTVTPTTALQIDIEATEQVWIRQPGNGASALSKDMAGLRLSSISMNTSVKYFPPILWMSEDPNFTTENPKLMALITAESTIAYNADNQGGARLIFGTTPNTPGTTSVPLIRMFIDQDGGVVVGSPTGASQGVGTLNATALYDDGALVADDVFAPDYPLLSIAETTAFYRAHQHLPTIPGREEWEQQGKPSVGAAQNYLTETVEVLTVYITQLHERLCQVEDRAKD